MPDLAKALLNEQTGKDSHTSGSCKSSKFKSPTGVASPHFVCVFGDCCCTIDDILLLDQVFVKCLQEVGLHGEAPAVGLHAAALLLQLVQQRAPLSCIQKE